MYTAWRLSNEFGVYAIRMADIADTRDWAGIEGIWWCGFCFCDHTDLAVRSLVVLDHHIGLTSSIVYNWSVVSYLPTG